jgi:NADH-quinone oxidoreductase subunit N
MLFYISVYSVTLIGAFAVCAFVRHATGGEDLAHFVGLRRRSATAAAGMAVFLLTLAGLPPLPGFFGKFYLFSAALQAEPSSGLLWLVSLALFGSLVSLYYYLVVLRAIFAADNSTAAPPPAAIRHSPARLTIVLSAVIVVALGIAPQLLVRPIATALR